MQRKRRTERVLRSLFGLLFQGVIGMGGATRRTDFIACELCIR
jgi:hypothetical protein